MARLKKKPASSSAKKPQALPGMVDILPGTDRYWDYMITKLELLSRAFGFSRADLPLLEEASLYENYDIGNNTIINFMDPEGNRVAIRPETLPGLLRAFSEYRAPETEKITKLYYISPVITYDERQKRFVNSWEYGFEIFGEFMPLTEAQLISLVWKFLKSIGLDNLSMEINSIGTPECRGGYDETLRNFLQSRKYDLCNDCVGAIDEDPMHVFRCKNLECQTVAQEAPQVVDYLDENCRKQFTSILEGLDELGIAYALNPMLVGKESAAKTIFTIKYKAANSEFFIGEGSYHDEMIKELTGKPIRCFGFTGYLEVLQKALQALAVLPPPAHQHERVEVFLVPLGDLAAKKALRLFSELWDNNVVVHDHFGQTGVKNQLKEAENQKAVVALIIGQKEAMDEMVILRDVKSGMQEVFASDRIVDEVKKRLGK